MGAFVNLVKEGRQAGGGEKGTKWFVGSAVVGRFLCDKAQEQTADD